MCSGRQLFGSSVALLVGLLAFGAHAGPSLRGSWGGNHIALVVTETGARIELDCGHGRLDEPLRTSADGTFEARGTYVPEAGGPAESGKPSTARVLIALYKGWTDGGQMRLTILVPETGREIGTFSLCSGCQPRLEKCL
jgi:hypothetical protein